ncbi:hypothetical protein B0H13DRAFT_1862126 [Mycena leptocephala]|nr:hypothetical protein B0H13DRAFT_1862126 [Mycena leptocephala]
MFEPAADLSPGEIKSYRKFSSPAFADSRKLRDFISDQKKFEHPRGMGWEGVLHHLNFHEVKLPKHQRYVHTAMSKNGFNLVVTMHPQIAILIHKLLSLSIDYTFKCVDGDMDEWEVAGFLERYKHSGSGLTFASLGNMSNPRDTCTLLTD